MRNHRIEEKLCAEYVPYHGDISCDKKTQHKGDHAWKGFVGVFQSIAMKITWEDTKKRG